VKAFQNYNESDFKRNHLYRHPLIVIQNTNGTTSKFFLHQDDQVEFDKLLKSFGDIVILPYFHYDNKVSIVKDTIIRDLRKEENRVYLIRRQDFDKIKLKHIENFGYWLLHDYTLPVVHFDRSVTRSHKIEGGRLYFEADYVDMDEMSMIRKPDDFIRWADHIIKTVRRKLKKVKYRLGIYNYTVYLGEHADKWRQFHRADMGGGTVLTSTIEN